MLLRLLTGFTWLLLAGHPLCGTLIDFTDREDLKQRSPIVIAHRGGVVTDSSPECSRTAIRLAADAGYDMVELDVRKSKDGVPILFHDATLKKACNRAGSVGNYTSNTLQTFSYVNSKDTIQTLDQAFALCHKLSLGVMLDLKAGRDDVPFLKRLQSLIIKHGLSRAAISFSGSDAARSTLTTVRFTLTDSEKQALEAGTALNLGHRFWFGLPRQLPDSLIDKLNASGALILPAINTFRYPSDQHMALAKADIDRLLAAGVHGFQTDSIYWDMIPK